MKERTTGKADERFSTNPETRALDPLDFGIRVYPRRVRLLPLPSVVLLYRRQSSLFQLPYTRRIR